MSLLLIEMEVQRDLSMTAMFGCIGSKIHVAF